jgi:protoporphyrinogen oxidase
MRVVDVGAGIAGLGAATYFAKKGLDVRLLEASGRVGGRAVTLDHPKTGSRCDVGTQYYHSSYERALGLIREVGLEGTLHRIQGDTRFFDDRVRKGSFLVSHRIPWIRAAGVSGNLKSAGFLIHRLLRHRMSTFALEDRPHLDGVKAFDVITDPTLREFLVRPLMIAGGLSEPDPTDVSLLQVLRLIRIIVLTDYLSLAGGTASLHLALADRLPVELETPVRALVTEGDRVRGVLLETGEIRGADHVVVATTANRAASLVPEDWSVEREFLSGVRIPPAVIVTFFLDRPLESGVWSYYSQAGTDKRVSFCTDLSQ